MKNKIKLTIIVLVCQMGKPRVYLGVHPHVHVCVDKNYKYTVHVVTTAECWGTTRKRQLRDVVGSKSFLRATSEPCCEPQGC